MAQHSHILRAVTKANAGIIFMKIDMQDPMEAVFNGSMSTGSGKHTLCIIRQ